MSHVVGKLGEMNNKPNHHWFFGTWEGLFLNERKCFRQDTRHYSTKWPSYGNFLHEILSSTVESIPLSRLECFVQEIFETWESKIFRSQFLLENAISSLALFPVYTKDSRVGIPETYEFVIVCDILIRLVFRSSRRQNHQIHRTETHRESWLLLPCTGRERRGRQRTHYDSWSNQNPTCALWVPAFVSCLCYSATLDYPTLGISATLALRIKTIGTDFRSLAALDLPPRPLCATLDFPPFLFSSVCLDMDMDMEGLKSFISHQAL